VYDTSIQNPTSCLGFSIFADAEAALFPSVSLSAEVLAPPFGTARASAAATYYFQVVGGNVGDIVPIMVQTSLSAFSLFPQDPHGWAQANLTLFSSADGFRRGPSICTYVSICGSFVTEFSGTRSIHAASGATGDFVNLTVEAFAGTSPDWDYPEFGRAFADPYIFIDPTFPNASLYSIVVSPGVGNAAPAAVPEPATLWLWFVGTSVGALGLLRRRQSWI
jgi:hypothetical protein